jgi:hypothetical protein
MTSIIRFTNIPIYNPATGFVHLSYPSLPHRCCYARRLHDGNVSNSSRPDTTEATWSSWRPRTSFKRVTDTTCLGCPTTWKLVLSNRYHRCNNLTKSLDREQRTAVRVVAHPARLPSWLPVWNQVQEVVLH